MRISILSLCWFLVACQLGDANAESRNDRFAQHAARLAQRAPAGFHVVVEPPFVIVGDGPRTAVESRAVQTVRWAVQRLKKAYFARDPDRILDIWLFKDAQSYEFNAQKLFGEKPSTPYGYYSSADNALVMNIATGGGTLVHELVHPFVEANFPGAPAWLNEGLGSLYEQSSTRDGHIVGLTNWRLPGLQQAIRDGYLGSLKKLTSTTTSAFYEDPSGTNYAQARYLLYYLQQRGLLHGFYHRFYANRARDPTGYKTLLATLGVKKDQTVKFESEWRTFVLALRYR